ncbi:MAG: hypothetical protein GVY19_07990 [Bacteroidetes bacterium]|jgi:signal transduction histidine kinase|nr:hypothetical protein [Bacteroidota bacterium]
MEHCENYLWALAENIILKNRIKCLENQGQYNSLDFSSLYKYNIGIITLSDNLVIKQINFESNTFNTLTDEFTGKPYSALVNTSSYNFHFPVINTSNFEEPQLLSCSGEWYDNAIAIVTKDSENNDIRLFFYAQKPKVSGIELINIKDAQHTAVQSYAHVLNTIIETSQDGVFLINTNRELQLANSNGKQLLLNYYNNYPKPGEIFDRYIATGHLKKYLQCTNDAIKGKYISEEVVVRTPKGKQEWFDYQYYPVLNNDNEVLFLLLIFHNKTRARIIERRYYETKLKADESDRLKKAFLNSMSHEIRTPMNGIMGFADLLNRPSLPEEKKQKYATLIRDNGKNLLNAFEEVMDIARMESGEMILNEVQFDINKTFDDILFYCKNQLLTKRHTNIKITCHKGIDHKAVYIYADKGKIKQIMLNLLSNSFKNTLSGYIEFGYYMDHSGLLNIYTSDTGKGVNRQQRNRLERHDQPTEFVTLQNEGAMKTGMGLSIVKGYVEFLNGNMQLRSQNKLGSVFKIQLPLSGHVGNREAALTPIKENIVYTYCSLHHLQWLKPIMNVLSEHSKVQYYSLTDFPPLRSGCKQLFFFHAGQQMSLIKQIIDQKNQPGHTFLYISDQPTQDEKEICFSYGIHEYLSYDMDVDYFTDILNKYIYF